MKKVLFLMAGSVIVLNLLVLSTFLSGDLKASPPIGPGGNCDCSWYNPSPLGGGTQSTMGGGDYPYGCYPQYGYVDCFYDPGPMGYPQWIPEPFMECIDGLDEDYCNCSWEFNNCGTSNFDSD